jgi:glycosyltransferase involved in cell wall biosynthesis
VNLVGFLEGELGLGEVARRMGKSLERAGIPFSAISYRRTPSRQQHPPGVELCAKVPYDTNLIFLNADHLQQFTADAGVEFFADRYSIGVWFWETNVLRDVERAASRYLDEVWVASDYVRRAVAPHLDLPVHVVPVPVEAPAEPGYSRSDLALPAAFTFLYLFDFVSAVRKNPQAVVEAFTRAFAPAEGPVLVLKSINGRERKPALLAELESAVGDRPDIRIRDGYVGVEMRHAITAACDCFVSLHRSEGLGLAIAEAMAHAKPVVATGYSGNLEFMNEDNSYLVPYRLIPVPPDWWAYAPGATWAEPDVGRAAALLRGVWEDQDEARARGRRARDELLEHFSPERTSAFVSSRLDEARSHGAVDVRRSPHDARPPILEASQELAKGVGEGLVERAGSPPTSLVRRLLRRALWPYLEDQERFERSVLDSLSALHRSQEELGRRVAQLEAQPTQQPAAEEGEESAWGRRERADT